MFLSLLIEFCFTPMACMLQMIMRILMTCLVMSENLLRLIMQTIYNCMSFLLQILSLIPICLVFYITTRLRCLAMCTGVVGGGCGVRRGVICDCAMALLLFAVIYVVLNYLGVLKMISEYLGYEVIIKEINVTTTRKYARTTRSSTLPSTTPVYSFRRGKPPKLPKTAESEEETEEPTDERIRFTIPSLHSNWGNDAPGGGGGEAGGGGEGGGDGGSASLDKNVFPGGTVAPGQTMDNGQPYPADFYAPSVALAPSTAVSVATTASASTAAARQGGNRRWRNQKEELRTGQKLVADTVEKNESYEQAGNVEAGKLAVVERTSGKEVTPTEDTRGRESTAARQETERFILFKMMTN